MKFKALVAALSLLLAVPTVASAAPRPAKPEFKPKPPQYAPNTQIFGFPSGMQVLMQADHSHPVVSIMTIIDAGSKDDPTGREEVAHFVEHTWFRSVHGDLPPIMDVINDLGTMFNATTRNDWTDYRTVANADYLPLLLRLESNRLTEPYKGVTEDQIDIEREVIRNEWRRRNEQGKFGFLEYMFENVYPEDHPYHGSSTHETIDNIKLADLQEYMDKHYNAANTTVVVVGDFDPAEASSLIFENFDSKLLHPDLEDDDYFRYPKAGIENPDQDNPDHWLTGAWDPNSPEDDRKPFPLAPRTEDQRRITESRPPVPEVGNSEIAREKAPIPHKLMALGWSLPGGYRADHWSIQILGWMGSNFMSRGFQDEIKRRAIGDVYCFPLIEVQATTFTCVVEIRDKKLEEAWVRDRMLNQFSEMTNMENWRTDTIGGSITKNVLERAKLELLSETLLTSDLFAMHFGGRADNIAVNAHYKNSPNAMSEAMKALEGIDPAGVIEVASKYIKRDRVATVIIEPLPEDQVDTTSENSTYSGASAADGVMRSSDNLETLTEEQIIDAYVKPKLEEIEDFELPNGMRVVVLPHGEAPVVQASVLFGRNYHKEDGYTYDFVDQFTQSIGHDPLPIAAKTNYFVNPGMPGIWVGYGKPFWGIKARENYLRLDVTAPGGNLDGALWMLREEIETSRGDVGLKPEFVKAAKKRLYGRWLNEEWHVRNARDSYLFPDHPLGTPGSYEDVVAQSEMSNATVDQYLADHFQPSNATLLVVGNINADNAKQLAERYFGGWEARKGARELDLSVSQPKMPTGKKMIYIFDDPKRSQSQIMTECRLNYDDPKLEPAVDVLKSLVWNKTFQQLRVTEGLAYSPGGSARYRANGMSAKMTFYSLAVNAGIGRTIEYFHEAIRDVEEGKISEEEVKLHKLRKSRESGVASQSMGQMTDTLTGVITRNADWDLAANRGKYIAAVDKEMLQKMAEGCSDHTVTTIQGPKDIITPQLDERGYEYEIVEWRANGNELLWNYDPKEAKKREKKKQKSAKKKAREKARAEKKAERKDDEETEETEG